MMGRVNQHNYICNVTYYAFSSLLLKNVVVGSKTGVAK